MCGILGGFNTTFDAASVEALSHRGPDQSDFRIREIKPGLLLTLGQTRLNVVDRHDIELPVCIGENVILFNGEIYNHLELRKDLEALGHAFATRTDTEVALAAYLEWGTDCLRRFNGMFGLAIWDGQRLFCARDRVGKKPLFYRYHSGRFEFASEIKAFGDLEFIGHDLFDLFEFCMNEHTLYRDIFSLKPGGYLFYDPHDGTVLNGSYWDIPHRTDRRLTDPAEAVHRFLELLEDSVQLRLRADVPVTLFLSGGLDSALIAKFAGVEEVYTCQFTEFAETINEEIYAKDLAERLGFKLNVIKPTREQFLADLSALAYHLEMPTGSFSVFPLYRLAKACREGDYKVVLSGEGSDEIFGGYVRNEFLMAGSHVSADEKKARHYSAMLDRFEGSQLDRFCRMASRSGLTGAALMKAFLTHFWNKRKSMLENICYVEARVFLQPLLQMSDRMCMAHGVEARCPFLDHRLIEFAFSLDDSLRYRDGIGKWIVHQAAQQVLPAGSRVLEREVKHGLPTPVNLWLQGRHSFDRKYWNALLTAECIKSLLQT